ncbi:hypothetical protein [Lacticigenium naphthae]|uniref:hypothetical protein n=1 Tax=Lacticigenium naphthae TaxID=515351 RepID=UPI000408DBEF|nr:hypothetical protein [Lacticigenium naphthae]
MLRTGIFFFAIGFVTLIFGLAGEDNERIWLLLISGVLILIGYLLYHKGEKEDNHNQF